MSNDVPLICDPVPRGESLRPVWADGDTYRHFSDAEMANFVVGIERAIATGKIHPDDPLYSDYMPREWPDAEYCAA